MDARLDGRSHRNCGVVNVLLVTRAISYKVPLRWAQVGIGEPSEQQLELLSQFIGMACGIRSLPLRKEPPDEFAERASTLL